MALKLGQLKNLELKSVWDHEERWWSDSRSAESTHGSK